jgi:hypothetical protein
VIIQKRLNRLLRAGGIGTAFYLFKDKLRQIPFLGDAIDALLGDGLSFEDSLAAVEGKLEPLSETLKRSMGEITFNEDDETIESHGTSTMIDKDEKKLYGLDKRFNSFSETIFSAVLTNHIKYEFKGKCTSKFYIGK